MKNERQFSGVEKLLLALITLASICSIGFYIVQFHQNEWSNNPEDFGNLGDYIGGVLGTSIALISIVLLYRTYRTQLDITNTQERQSEIQQFENTFFQLLSNQRTILMTCKGTFYDSRSMSSKQRGVVLSDYQYIDKIAEELRLQMLNFEYDPSLLDGENINLIRIVINDYYLEVFSKQTSQLSHYFRHLYHILKYVETSNVQDKRKYTDLVQAQMSNNELYIAFYNGISIYGRKRMLPLMDQYSFLENLKDTDYTTKRHRELFYKKTTFKEVMIEKGNIIFIGGIHGAGKSFLSTEISKKLGISHLSSSEVLKWDQKGGKKVENVEFTQNILIQNLKKIIAPDEKYILDGHFCLVKTDNSIEEVPLNTFREINPILIIIVTDELKTIKERLEKRDNKRYDIDVLQELQKKEVEYATNISNELGIECVEVSPQNIDSITPIICKVIGE